MPGFRIVSPDPAAIRACFSWIFLYSPERFILVSHWSADNSPYLQKIYIILTRVCNFFSISAQDFRSRYQPVRFDIPSALANSRIGSRVAHPTTIMRCWGSRAMTSHKSSSPRSIASGPGSILIIRVTGAPPCSSCSSRSFRPSC